ncbi:MAG: ABC transporter permease [Candidatus Saccharibacteria bacterium]|nr:ABC transporter permease [Candidatus Saccharibacteria bacterium]
MRSFTNANIAVDSLRNSRTRTNMTMLGIIIGVVSITLILSLGESIRQSSINQVNQLGNNLIVVRPGGSQAGSLTENNLFSLSPIAPYATTTLQERDVKTLAKQNNVTSVTPLMLINGSIDQNQRASEQASILATTPSFATTLKLEPSNGQFIDEETNSDTVVIGQQLAIDMYGTDQILGKRLKIRGIEHTIIGVLQRTNQPIGISGVDIDHSAIISIEDGKSFNQGVAQIQQILIVPISNAAKQSVINNSRKILTKQHNGEKDFQVMAGEDAVLVSKNFYKFITTLTAIVAGISLVVGGVGIMNIMLVAVAERTREIGIRKSLGASNRHIMWQFLIEALIISVVGGIIGIIIAIAAALFIGLMLGLTPIVSLQVMAISLGLSVCVGVIFGLGPAIRASMKDPIEALREQN